MACKVAIFFFAVAFFFSLVIPLTASPPISAVFAFGDSTLDPGNNDHINTLMRSDHRPYGCDFPGHVASGRFSNGKLVPDFLVSLLGLKNLLPAYLDPSVTDRDLLTGVSFASAGSGLDDLTTLLSNVLRMSTQLQYFEQALNRIRRTVGSAEADRIVGDALFVIGVGTNDLLFNFYDVPTRRLQYSISGYHDFLLQKLDSVIRRLYRRGARRFLVSGLPPIGCVPMQVTVGKIMPGGNQRQRVCVDQQNIDSQSYNAKLQALILRLQSTLPGSRIAYTDIYNPLMDMVINPTRYGFEHTLQGCCGTGSVEMGSLCGGMTPTCRDPSKYLFWDAVHPTQAAYQILANIYSTTVLPHLLS
ncbi:hypothetical protein HHK36_018598 [Tetracentron sinense]|uniref:Uncharacterized protein n=1 Tax=Tetracentron sinense TaxID=13715 RepID=A0A835DBF1_TETSI|nr:hypothetical protein HHK36_018598 [Tetracentron sinense]